MNIRVSVLALMMPVLSCSAGQDEITPVPFNEVTLEEGFWKTRMQTELDVTVPFSVEKCIPARDRFRQCAEFREGKTDVPPFSHAVISSDLYKAMEGVAYSLMLRPDKDLEAFMDSTADLIARSQLDDGYLYISHICGNPITFTSRIYAEIRFWILWEMHRIQSLLTVTNFMI